MRIRINLKLRRVGDDVGESEDLVGDSVMASSRGDSTIFSILSGVRDLLLQ